MIADMGLNSFRFVSPQIKRFIKIYMFRYIMKSVNLTSVKFNPRWVLYAIAGVILLVVVWQIANWVTAKLKGVAGGIIPNAGDGF